MHALERKCLKLDFKSHASATKARGSFCVTRYFNKSLFESD